jgi:hypothetical protein
MIPKLGDVVINKATGDRGVVLAIVPEPPDGGVRIGLQIRESADARNVPEGDGNTFTIVKTSPARLRRFHLKVHTNAEVEIAPSLRLWISRSVSPGRLVVAISGPRTRTGLGIHEFVKDFCSAWRM